MTTPRLACAALTGAILLGPAPPAGAADWPQWRGPDRNGISTETGWSTEGRPEDVWSASVGLGYSSVAVSDGRLFTMGYDEAAGEDRVLCLDAKTGRELWRHAYPAEIWDRMHKGGTLTTPSVDGDVVYTLNRAGRFFCFEVDDGTVLLDEDVTSRFDVTPPTWGFSASPLILEDRVVLNLGRTVALRKRSVEEIWRTRDFGHAYSTPSELTVGGRDCLAIFDGAGLAVVDLETGSELGFHEWKTQYDVNAASPVIVDGRIFISSGLNRGCALVECTPAGLEVLWENKSMRTKMSGCVLWDGHLYGFDESILKCIDVDGHEMWRERGIGNGSLMIADGRLIVIGSKGELIIARATPEGYEELSRAACLSGGVFWTMPVLADGLIYCRSSKGALVCRDHRASPGASE